MNGSRVIHRRPWARVGPIIALVAVTASVLVVDVGARDGSGGAISMSGSALVDSLGKEILAFEGIPSRPVAEISADIDAAQRASTAAEQDQSAANQLAIVMKARVEVMDQVIDVTKAQLDLAKKEKREADTARLENLRDQQELQMAFFQRLVELQQAIADHAEARKELANARVSAFQLENDLEARRDALQGISGGGPMGKMEKPLRDLEKRTIEAMGNVASREQDVAGKDKNVSDRRMSVFQLTGEYREFLQRPSK